MLRTAGGLHVPFFFHNEFSDLVKHGKSMRRQILPQYRWDLHFNPGFQNDVEHVVYMVLCMQWCGLIGACRHADGADLFAAQCDWYILEGEQKHQ